MLDSLYPKYYLDMASEDGGDDTSEGGGEYPGETEPTEIPSDVVHYYPEDYPPSIPSVNNGTTYVTTPVGPIGVGKEIKRCWTCEESPNFPGQSTFGCRHTSTTQGQRPTGCLSYWQCAWNCDTGRGFGPMGKLGNPHLPNQVIRKKSGESRIINNIKGSFDPISGGGETREYIIVGDIGSKFKLTIYDESDAGCILFDQPCEITNPNGFTVTVIFPKAYEYTSYIFALRAEFSTILGGGMPKIEVIGEIPQYVNPIITLSFATDDPYTTNCAYSGDDVTFSAKPFTEPLTLHTLNDKTYGVLTHAVAATITTGYLYVIKTPNISDYLLIDDRKGLSTADLDKALELGTDETILNGTITATESTSKKVITLTSTVQINKVGKEDTVYELDVDSIITNIPQAFEQKISTKKDTAVTIDVLKGINIATYLTPTITSTPKHGTLVTSSFAAGVGTCTYTPPDLFQGEDEFMFEVTDGTNTSEDQYLVSIKVGTPGCDNPIGKATHVKKCWTCEPGGRAGSFGCMHTSSAQDQRPAGCMSWWSCFTSCNPGHTDPFGLKLGTLPWWKR